MIYRLCRTTKTYRLKRFLYTGSLLEAINFLTEYVIRYQQIYDAFYVDYIIVFNNTIYIKVI